MWLSLRLVSFIFALIKLGTPLIQAHFAESFRPVAFTVTNRQATGFFLFILHRFVVVTKLNLYLSNIKNQTK